MPLIGLPSRFILTLIKRGFISLCLLSILYLLSNFIMGHLSENNRVFVGVVGSLENNAFVGSNFNITDVSATTAKKSTNLRNQKIPKLILDQSNVKSPHNINRTKHNDDLRRAKEGRQWRQRDENKNPLKNENDQQFLALINENDDDSAYEIENATKMINGRIVHVRQKPISHANDDHLSKLNVNNLKASYKMSNNLLDIDKYLPLCLEPSPFLIGKMKQSTLLMTSLKESDVLKVNPDLSTGGSWRPKHCRPKHKIAIIVPFRDRQSHLTRLIDFLVPMLKRQLLDFRFIVTEQYGRDLFNKGRIMNAAFEFAEQQLRVNCVIFHDVDMFPQDDRNFYGCPEMPRHIGAFVNTLGYELWYNYIVGGALAVQVDHYITVNGYSNMFWAWGGEDDDMGLRILANNMTIERPHPVIGRMTMLKHIKRQKTAPVLVSDLIKSSATRWTKDGLNETKWAIRKIKHKRLYYHLYVDVGTVPSEWRNGK